jgi:hypothetical protein
MRFLPLLVMVCVCGAADYVELTLKNGRVLVGEYDTGSEIMDLGNGRITIHQDQIAKSKAIERQAAKAPQPNVAHDAPPATNSSADKAWVALGAADAAYRAAARKVIEDTLAKVKAERARMQPVKPNDDMTIAQHKAAVAANEICSRLDNFIGRTQSLLNPQNAESQLNRDLASTTKCVMECEAVLKVVR